MSSQSWRRAFGALQIAAALATAVSVAKAEDEDTVRFRERSMSGPRLGVTWVSGDQRTIRDLEDRNIGRFVSQFGWQFERQIVPEGGGPQFVLEAVPMVGGVEYGKVFPSLTLAMGVRFPGGAEFGIGPNAFVTGGGDVARSALVIAVGKSFDYGGVSLPLNLAWATSPRSQRLSFVFGYAVQRFRTARPTPVGP